VAGPPETRVVVLHEEGRSYRLLDLDAEGLPATVARAALPEGFRGTGFDLRGIVAVSATGEPTGNNVYVTDLPSGLTSVVPLPQPAEDPGLVRYLNQDTVLVPARGSGIVYGLAVADLTLVPLTGEIAQTPEQVLPFGARLYVLDGNLDRATGTPVGPSRVIVLNPGTGLPTDTVELGGLRAFRGGLSESKLFVLEALAERSTSPRRRTRA
jgi:hypothetical protein